MKKKLISLLLTLALLGTLTAPAAAYSATALVPQARTYDTPFTDLRADWYRSAVQTCYEAGLMSGKSDTAFDPGGTLTYAEIFVIAARMHSLFHGGDGALPTPGPGQPWYQGAVEYLFAVAEAEGESAEDGEDGLEDDWEDDDLWYIEYILDEIKSQAKEPCLRWGFVEMLWAVLPEGALEPVNDITVLPDILCAARRSAKFRGQRCHLDACLCGRPYP